MSKTSENMTYLIDNKNFLCQHNKLHPLTARRGKWISETLYREIKTIIKNDSPKCITSEGVEDLLHQKLTNCKINYDQYHCSDCSQSFCLDIKDKRTYLDKWYNIVETLNMNNEDLDKCYGVSTDFISKLNVFFHNHWWKGHNQHSMGQNASVKKCNADLCIWNHVLTVG